MNEIKCDNHIHSKYSWDSKEEIQTIVNKASNLGLNYISITDHVEFANQPVKDVIKRLNTRNDEIDAIQKYSKAKIIKGVEISEPHLYSKEVDLLKGYTDLDYIIGSIHHILGLPMKKMINYEDAYRKYLESMLKMVTSSDIDTLAHLDYIKRYFIDYLDEDLLKEILKTIIDRDILLEINTSGIRRYGDHFPSNDIIELYKSLGGKNIILGSDAHNSDDIYTGIEETKNELENLKENIVIKRRIRTI